MKRIAWLVVAMALAPAGAGAEDIRLACAKGEDRRIIEVVTPGEVGKICDVRYARADGADASVPYHADNSREFCGLKAAGLAQTLTEAGYTCSPAAQTSLAAKANVEPKTEAAKSVAPARKEQALATASRSAPDPQKPLGAESSDDAAADAAGNEPLKDRMRAILAAPAPAGPRPEHAAVRGPAQLTAGVNVMLASSEQPSAVGRLVGAAPANPGPSTEQRASAAPSVSIAASQTSAAPAAPPSAAVETAVNAGALRRPEDVIRATLQAQAAAWNEGDLDAFMQTYWKSDDLKFVSGTEITKGWSATMKRYRDRYADASGLGWLAFDRLEVTMTTDDVAIVTGRFNHTKGDAAASGTFSLVMRRQDGVWRIVHDHTSVDPTPAQ